MENNSNEKNYYVGQEVNIEDIDCADQWMLCGSFFENNLGTYIYVTSDLEMQVVFDYDSFYARIEQYNEYVVRALLSRCDDDDIFIDLIEVEFALKAKSRRKPPFSIGQMVSIDDVEHADGWGCNGYFIDDGVHTLVYTSNPVVWPANEPQLVVFINGSEEGLIEKAAPQRAFSLAKKCFEQWQKTRTT